MSTREGTEPDTFWGLLGGKAEYPKEKEMRKQIEEPHLFTCSCHSGNGKHLFAFAFFHFIVVFCSSASAIPTCIMPNVRVVHDWFCSSLQMYSRYHSHVY